eukprot:24417-Eustigmatos_ZCMA.PRE.1
MELGRTCCPRSCRSDRDSYTGGRLSTYLAPPDLGDCFVIRCQMEHAVANAAIETNPPTGAWRNNFFRA